MINIRKGIPEDLEEITYVNRKTWKTTYPNIVDKEFLDNLPLTIPEEDLEVKKKEVVDGKSNYIVALDGEKIIGMLKYANADGEENKDTAEIKALYILQEYQKHGIGKKMVNMATKEMAKENYKNMIIGCMVENPANEFYEKIGGIHIGKRDFVLDNRSYKENVYFYALEDDKRSSL